MTPEEKQEILKTLSWKLDRLIISVKQEWTNATYCSCPLPSRILCDRCERCKLCQKQLTDKIKNGGSDEIGCKLCSPKTNDVENGSYI